ncbi:hypothetical protein [Streptomyces sp. NPDC047928]|uniref:hypothetical protein n=1 Tax=unclassified Streptomyces TaxID=2593676 RepID=UPI003723F29F
MSGESVDAGAGRAQQVGQAAKEQASATAGEARQAAGDVAGTAAEQAKAVTHEARRQAGSAVRDLRERVTGEAQGQTERLAEVVRQWADDLAGMAQNAPNDSPARSLVAQAADGGHQAADYLDKQGAGGLVQDLQRFARRRPAAFLAGAALSGLVVGRLAKAGSKAGSTSRADSPARTDSAPRTAAVPGGGAERSLPEAAARPELPGYPGGAA